MCSGIRALAGSSHCSFRPAVWTHPTSRSVNILYQEDIIVIVTILQVILSLIRRHFRHLDDSPEPWLTCGVRDPSLESAKRILLSRTRFPGLRRSLTTLVSLAQLLIQSGLVFVNNRSDLGINIILVLNDIFCSCLCFIRLFNVGWFLPCFVLQY